MSGSSSREQLLRRIENPAHRVRKSERTREAILRAAMDFLWTRPFRDLTVSGLMSRAGSSRPTFYQYFRDLHELMETLLTGLKQDIVESATPWFQGEGDPVSDLEAALRGLVRAAHAFGPALRAVTDAAPSDSRLEKAWAGLLEYFDGVVADRIEEDQKAGRIPEFDAQPVAVALNRMDASTLSHHFGRRPQSDPDLVYESIRRVWISTLYCAGGRSGSPASLPPLACSNCAGTPRKKGKR